MTTKDRIIQAIRDIPVPPERSRHFIAVDEAVGAVEHVLGHVDYLSRDDVVAMLGRYADGLGLESQSQERARVEKLLYKVKSRRLP